MGFKTKWNRFWTLRNTEGGFTLVELVVVIAILAILAGVAVPAYTGYIKRAREAGDQLLIAAVNEAFVSSCLEAGVEMIEVSEAKISVSEQLVFGVSSVTTTTEAELNVICSTFNQLFEGNFNTAFVTENVKSLDWDPDVASFKMDHENSVASRIMLSSGKSFTVDPETMADIQASAYASMGYAEVAQVIDNLTESSEDLVGIAQALKMGDKFSAVLVANGLVNNATEADGMNAGQMANGLQMVTAKYLAGASEDQINELLSMDVGGFLGTTTGMLQNVADGSGGTKTVSAAALQYALAESYAKSSFAEGQKITIGKWDDITVTGTKTYEFNSISEFLASDLAKSDPVWALNKVQGTSGYSSYTTDEQYKNDINGFVGTMSILGDNIGTVKDPGAVDITDYFNNGVHSQDAQEGLTAVLGK